MPSSAPITKRFAGGSQLEDVIQALPAAVYATDAAGRITFYNEAAAELWGCRPETRKERVLRLLEALLARWQTYAPRPMSNGAGVERTAGSPRHGGGGRATGRHPCPFRSLSNPSVRRLGHPDRRCEHADRHQRPQTRRHTCATACINCRIIRRRDCQQGPQRHHHKLEWRCRAAVRLQGGRGHRQANHDPNSCRSH